MTENMDNYYKKVNELMQAFTVFWTLLYIICFSSDQPMKEVFFTFILQLAKLRMNC